MPVASAGAECDRIFNNFHFNSEIRPGNADASGHGRREAIAGGGRLVFDGTNPIFFEKTKPVEGPGDFHAGDLDTAVPLISPSQLQDITDVFEANAPRISLGGLEIGRASC